MLRSGSETFPWVLLASLPPLGVVSIFTRCRKLYLASDVFGSLSRSTPFLNIHWYSALYESAGTAI